MKKFLSAIAVIAAFLACEKTDTNPGKPYIDNSINDGSTTTVTPPVSLGDTIDATFGGKQVQIYLVGNDTLAMEDLLNGTKTYFARNPGTGSGFEGTWIAYQQVTGTTVYDISSSTSDYFNLDISQGISGVTITVDKAGQPVYTAQQIDDIVGIWYYEIFGMETWYSFNVDGTGQVVETYTSSSGEDTVGSAFTWELSSNVLTINMEYYTQIYEVSGSSSSMEWVSLANDTSYIRAAGTTGSGIVGTWQPFMDSDYDSICAAMSPPYSSIDSMYLSTCEYLESRYIFSADGTVQYIPGGFTTPQLSGNWSVSGDRFTESFTCTQDLAAEGMCTLGETIATTTQYFVQGDALLINPIVNLTRVSSMPQVVSGSLGRMPAAPVLPRRPGMLLAR